QDLRARSLSSAQGGISRYGDFRDGRRNGGGAGDGVGAREHRGRSGSLFVVSRSSPDRCPAYLTPPLRMQRRACGWIAVSAYAARRPERKKGSEVLGVTPGR